MKKENGRKVSMKIREEVNGEDDGRLYACVRLTYAAD